MRNFAAHVQFTTRLSDVLFLNKKKQFWVYFEGSCKEKFYDHQEHLTAIWNILWTSGIVCVHLVYFTHFGIFGPRKICATLFCHFSSFRQPQSKCPL
jgi:hypothetical protein